MPQKIDYKRIGSSVRQFPDNPTKNFMRYASVSQITAFNPDQFGGCNRAWWYSKIMRLERPQTAAQDLGVEIHKQIETYLTTGEDVLGIVARAGFRFLPKPGADLGVEIPFGDEIIVEMFDKQRQLETHIEEVGGGRYDQNYAELAKWENDNLKTVRPNYLIADGNVPILGAIDVVNERGEWLDNDGRLWLTPDEPEVVDWKTSADIDKYAKTGPELIDTDQMIGYAKYASQRYPRANQIRISHGYFQTRGAPRAKKVSTLVGLDIIESRWQHIEKRVREMKHVARETDVTKIPANLDACSAYRGCAFAGQCPRAMKSTIMAAFHAAEKTENKGTRMGLLDKLRKGESLAPATPVANPTPAKPPASGPTITEEIARLRAEEQANDPNTGHKPELEAAIAAEVAKRKATENRGVCKVDGQTLTPDNSSQLANGTVVHIGCKVGVTPPDAPTSNPATNAAPVPPDALASLPPDIRSIVESHGATPPTTAAESATEKRKPGRPKKDAAPPPEVHGATIGELVAATTRELFVDCIVKGRVTVDLGLYIDNMCNHLATKFNAADIRCAPSDSPLSFGKWKGALAALIRENPPENGVYVLHGVRESEIKAVVVETLEPLCAVFVRGV
jgi:hypothetical protein